MKSAFNFLSIYIVKTMSYIVRMMRYNVKMMRYKEKPSKTLFFHETSFPFSYGRTNLTETTPFNFLSIEQVKTMFYMVKMMVYDMMEKQGHVGSQNATYRI